MINPYFPRSYSRPAPLNSAPLNSAPLNSAPPKPLRKSERPTPCEPRYSKSALLEICLPMPALIEQITSLVNHLELSTLDLSSTAFVKNELHELTRIADKLHDITVAIKRRTGSFTPSLEDSTWEGTADLRIKSQSAIAYLLSNGKLKNRSTFLRNIQLIFNGPKHDALDSKVTVQKKKSTQKKCQKIRELSTDGILSWAISYEPSLWTGGVLTNNMFDCLLEDIDPKSTLPWPTSIREELQGLLSHDALENSSTYNSFANGENIANPKSPILLTSSSCSNSSRRDR